jgi:hypothetical protein
MSGAEYKEHLIMRIRQGVLRVQDRIKAKTIPVGHIFGEIHFCAARRSVKVAHLFDLFYL